jgi:hypothetical protein
MWNWDRVLTETKAFFSSGLFHILIGCVFLYASYSVSLGNRAHSAFVFLLAVLGVALVLYGTGTNAAGEGSAGSIKVAIAGGAGVLALVLGFGVATHGNDIGTVFKRTMDYGVLKLQVAKDSSTGITASVGDFDVHARSGSARPLHLWNDGETIEILVPIDETGMSDVNVYLTTRPGAKELRDKIEETYKLPRNDKSQVKPEAGFTNEIVKAITREVDLSKQKDLPVVQPVTASNPRPVPLSVSPQ